MRQSYFRWAFKNKLIPHLGHVLLGLSFASFTATVSADSESILRQISASGVSLQVLSNAENALVVVSHPDGQVSEHRVGENVSRNLNAQASGRAFEASSWVPDSHVLSDGLYKYELINLPDYLHTRTDEEFIESQYDEVPAIAEKSSGSFRVLNGQVVSDQLVESANNQ